MEFFEFEDRNELLERVVLKAFWLRKSSALKEIERSSAAEARFSIAVKHWFSWTLRSVTRWRRTWKDAFSTVIWVEWDDFSSDRIRVIEEFSGTLTFGMSDWEERRGASLVSMIVFVAAAHCTQMLLADCLDMMREINKPKINRRESPRTKEGPVRNRNTEERKPILGASGYSYLTEEIQLSSSKNSYMELDSS